MACMPIKNLRQGMKDRNQTGHFVQLLNRVDQAVYLNQQGGMYVLVLSDEAVNLVINRPEPIRRRAQPMITR
jgi:hypothetical protein